MQTFPYFTPLVRVPFHLMKLIKALSRHNCGPQRMPKRFFFLAVYRYLVTFISKSADSIVHAVFPNSNLESLSFITIEGKNLQQSKPSYQSVINQLRFCFALY